MFGIGVQEVVGIAVIGLITWFVWDYLDSKNQPPGPVRFPFLGNLIQVALADQVPYVALYKICKRYGKHGVTRIQLGFMNTVFLNSVPALKDLYCREEALSRNAVEEVKVRNLNKNLGILLGDGRHWFEIRRFILTTLKTFGLSKRSVMEGVMSSEANIFHDEMLEMAKSSKDGTIRITPDFFNLTTLNIVLWMVTGQRCERNDKSSSIQRFIIAGRRFLDSLSIGSGLFNYWPFLKHVCPELCGYNLAHDLAKGMRDICQEVYEEAKASGNYKTSQNCFVDEFLAKIEEEEKNENKDEERFFTEESFVATLMDLIQAGSDTTSGNLSFGILFLASHPKVQDKIIEEITEIAGPDGVPCLVDRDRMPYTQAVIMEILRYGRVVIILPRKVLKDFWYEGYFFKKGTVLMLSAHNITMDDDVWGDPHNFRPERFINPADGTFNKVFADERMIPFGMGKRSCIGEGIARDAMFIMLTSFVKKLQFSLPEDRPKPSLDPVLSLTGSVVPFDVCINSRK